MELDEAVTDRKSKSTSLLESPPPNTFENESSQEAPEKKKIKTDPYPCSPSSNSDSSKFFSKLFSIQQVLFKIIFYPAWKEYNTD